MKKGREKIHGLFFDRKTADITAGCASIRLILSFVVFGSDFSNESFDLFDHAHDEVNEFLDKFHGSALLIHYSRISSHDL